MYGGTFMNANVAIIIIILIWDLLQDRSLGKIHDLHYVNIYYEGIIIAPPSGLNLFSITQHYQYYRLRWLRWISFQHGLSLNDWAVMTWACWNKANIFLQQQQQQLLLSSWAWKDHHATSRELWVPHTLPPRPVRWAGRCYSSTHSEAGLKVSQLLNNVDAARLLGGGWKKAWHAILGIFFSWRKWCIQSPHGENGHLPPVTRSRFLGKKEEVGNIRSFSDSFEYVHSSSYFVWDETIMCVPLPHRRV